MNFKIIKLALVVFLCSITPVLAIARTPTLLPTFERLLESSSISDLSSKLKEMGYTEVAHPAFGQKNVKVFSQEEDRGTDIFIIQYCGSTLTGLFTTVSDMDAIILTKDLETSRYKFFGKKNQLFPETYNKYRKKDITVNLISNPNSDLITNVHRKNFIHVSKKNNCHDDNAKIPVAPEYIFNVSSMEEIYYMANLSKADATVALAKSGYFEKSVAPNGAISQFINGNEKINTQFCDGKVKMFASYLSAPYGKQFEAGLKKQGFSLLKEQMGAKNSYMRNFENPNFILMVQYLGDIAGEDNRENAFRIISSSKKTSCE